MAELIKIESQLNLAIAKTGLSGKSPAEVALYLSTLMTRRNQTDDLHRIINEYSAALEPPSTQKLSPLEPIYVSPQPVSPNSFLFGILGLFIGLLICAVLCWREIFELLSRDESPQSVD